MKNEINWSKPVQLETGERLENIGLLAGGSRFVHTDKGGVLRIDADGEIFHMAAIHKVSAALENVPERVESHRLFVNVYSDGNCYSYGTKHAADMVAFDQKRVACMEILFVVLPSGEVRTVSSKHKI